MKKTLLAILAMVAAICAVPASAETVQIASASDWAAFANRVNNGETNLCAVMTADVTLTQDSPRVGLITGGEGAVVHPYAGDFNGAGHTLTLNWAFSDVQYVAPFAFTAGCKIHDLHVTGSIEAGGTTSNALHASGLIGWVYAGDVLVERCRCSVEITLTGSGVKQCGGFFGETYWNNTSGITLRDCLFDGALRGSDASNCGGFGYSPYNGPYAKIYNSLFAPSEVTVSGTGSYTFAGPFLYSYAANLTLSAAYYTQTFGEAQGVNAASMTAEQLVAALGGNWTVSDGNAVPVAFAGLKVLDDGQIYTVESDETLQGDVGLSAIVVATGARAVVNIKSGATLTVNGADASGAVGAMPAIYVPASSTLYIVGDGTLNATGGAAGNGCGGSSGGNGSYDRSRDEGTSGAGGIGGAGGGGGASAIGGIGGNGGAGGSGASGHTKKCEGSDFTANGADGNPGQKGSNGGGMGKVVILGNLTVIATAGAAATADGSGGGKGSMGTDAGSGNARNYSSGGGGGGGGGARGQNAQYGIGGGGAGGAGGGGGGSGGTQCTGAGTGYEAPYGQGGKGGKSYCNTSGSTGAGGDPETTQSTSYGTSSSGGGGAGGVANATRGGDGTLQAMDSVNLTVSPSRTAAQPTALQGSENVIANSTITFMSEESTIDTVSASFMFAPPNAPTATKDGYVFLGYYTADGVQFYDADNNCAYPVWPTVEDVTLYAAWGQIEAHVTFLSRGTEVGSGDFVRVFGSLVAPAAPSTTRNFCRFLGYFTKDEEGGVQIYDENCEFVTGSSSTWQPTGNVTLYAHWAPVTISFMSQGAAIGSPRPYQVSGDTVTPPTAPSVGRDGYRFDGYYRGLDKFYNENYQYVANLTELMQDVVLEAAWTKVYNIAFVSAGTTLYTVEYANGDTTPTAPSTSREDYRFLGYYTAETGGVQVYDASRAYVSASGFFSSVNENKTLYARWELTTVHVSFVTSGSTVFDTVAYNIDDDTAPTAPVATRRGNDRFLGYYTEQSGGTQVFDENYEFAESSLSSLSPDMTLYAHWKLVPTKLEGGITRLVYRGVLTNFGEWTSGLKKTMHVKVYDSASATTPLWSGDVANVPINPDGSFEAVFGNDDLALAFASNDVTHVELTVGDSLSPLAPRRAFSSVASVNRALIAEGAASDIKVGTLGAKSFLVEKVSTGSLEASGTVRVEGSVSVEVKPFDIERGRETTIWRGAGVTAWGISRRVKTANDVVAGQLLWTADCEGVAMIHCSGPTRSTLRIPATIQFVRPGDEVRAPTYDSGEVAVTVWEYKK